MSRALATVALGLALVSVASPVAAKPGFIAIPPLAAEVGALTPISETPTTLSSTEVRVAASWASLYWKPTPVDVSIGYIGSYRTLVGDYDLSRGISVDTRELRMHGAYLELAYAIENHRHWRTWLGFRGETLAGDYQGSSLQVIGGAVRLGAEVYSSGFGGASDRDSGALFAGTWALGLYVEGSARTLPKELGPLGVGAGVSVRIPFIAAVGS